MKTFLCLYQTLFFSKNIEQTVPSPSQVLDSGNEQTDNEYEKNEENYENEKITIMAKFKSFFDVYRDTFFSYVEKLMKGETSKMQCNRFKVWTRTTSAFSQRKAEEESEIWSNIYGYVVYDAIQMQISESLSLNRDHIKSIIPPARIPWTLWEHVFSNKLFEEYIKHTYKISTEKFNYRCNLSRLGFWYHHWLAKIGSFYCQCF